MSSLKRIGVCFGEEADSIVLLTNHITEYRPGRFEAYGLEEDEGAPYEVNWHASGMGTLTNLWRLGKPSYSVTVEVLALAEGEKEVANG